MTAVAQGYDPYEVPAAPGDGSRYMLAATPAGWASAPGVTLGVVYRNLLSDRESEAKPISPGTVGVKLGAVVEHRGEYRLVGRGPLVGKPTLTSQRASKRWGQLKGGPLLDSFFMGSAAWANAPDDEVLGAMVEVAQAGSLRSAELRTLNDTVALALALRAGLVVAPHELPAVIG